MESSPTFLLIGNGRLARHLVEYSRLLGIALTTWSRESSEGPERFLRSASHILLAISDDAIEAFDNRWRDTSSDDSVWVHFSGARSFSRVVGAHPLMTFGPRLYSLDEYKRIPIILERGGPPFDSILPGFPNPSYEISTEQKAMYHAWAVLATNSVSGTWREYRRIACEELALPEAALVPFLEKTAENALTLDSPLTGPIVRGDQETIRSNLEALKGSPFRHLYEALVGLFGKEHN